ncbi:MAG: hypothetical protein RLZZ249_1097 [Actinomycetota bacterium]
MTLRGLALATVAALGFSGVATLPASANGIDSGFVSLSPKTGTEYTVLATAGATFTLTANEASTLNVGSLKFLVTDPSGVVEVATGTSGRTFTLAGEDSNNQFSVSASGAVTVVSSYSALVAAGDRFELSADLKSTVSAALKTQVTASGAIFAVGTASSTVFQFDGGNAAAVAKQNLSIPSTVKVLREARDTVKNQFVVDTGTNDSTATSDLVLTVTGTTTREVTVVAWKDSNANDLIDSTEYQSPVRTVTFKKASELAVATSLTVVPGDQSLSARVTTTPVLNGNQMLAQNGGFLNVAFTRQDSSTVFYGPEVSSRIATWNDTTKQFTVQVSLRSGANVVSDTSSMVAANTNSGLAKPASGSNLDFVKATGSKTVTVTKANHDLRVGDYITVASVDPLVDTLRFKVTSVPSANTFSFAIATASGVISAGATGSYTVTTYESAPSDQNALVDRAFAGSYTAQAVILGVASGDKVTAEAVAATSDAVEFSTAQSATVQGTDGDDSTALVKVGTLAVPVKISVLDADEEGVSAGRPVVVSFTTDVTGAKVNDKTATQTLTTDANGEVALSVTSPAGVAGSVTVSAVAENGPSATFTLTWTAQSYGLVDLAGNGSELTHSTRAIVAGGSYALNVAVMDQWFAVAPSADYRLVVTGSGVAEGVKALTDGKASVTITDNGFQSAMATTITLQKLTSGVWGAVAGKAVVMTTNINKNTNSVVLGANGSALYASKTAKLSSAVAAKPLAAADYRLTTAAKPAYANNAVVTGKVQNAASSVGVAGAEVTITGPSSILFRDGNVDKLSSITVISNASGEFSVDLFSTTAQKDTVITVTALGKSSTTKVTFTGATSDGIGAKLEITAPASVAPASTLQVKAKLTDTFSNPVAAAVKVSYTGPGITFGALPTATDKDGELMFSALLGGGDTGNVVVTISYDQNGDGDYADAKDIVVSKTIAIVAPAAPAAPEVNAVIGSFNGRWAVRVENAKGAAVSVKVGGNWYKYTSLNENYLFSRKSAVGRSVAVAVYVNGTLENVATITIK